jgi:hypothetical protein
MPQESYRYFRFQGFADQTGATTTRLIELQAIEEGTGTNRLLNKTPITQSDPPDTGGAVSIATDGLYTLSGYPIWWTYVGEPTLTYDLGALYPLDYIRVMMYSKTTDGRQTRFKVWLSKDNVDWSFLLADYSTNTVIQPEPNGWAITTPAQVQQGTNFTASATDTISFLDSAIEVYTANGYNFTPNAILNIVFTQVATEVFTANFNSAAILNFALSPSGIEVYTPKGYNFTGNSLDPITFTDLGTSIYTANGYSFNQSGTLNIALTDSGTSILGAEGYDFTQNSEAETLLFTFSATEILTPKGYDFIQSSTISMAYTSSGTEVYTPNGYSYNQNAVLNIALTSLGTEVFKANFNAVGSNLIALTSLGTEVFTASQGVTFTANATANILFSSTATEVFTASNGVSFSMTGLNSLMYRTTPIQTYTQGQEGNFNQNAYEDNSLYDLASSVYVSNHMDFTASTSEILPSLTYSATEVLTPSSGLTFTANGIRNITFISSGAQVYFKQTILDVTQNGILSIKYTTTANSVYTNVFNRFTANAGENFALYITAESFKTSPPPQDHILNATLDFRLSIATAVLFNKVVYTPSYEEEIQKPNTLYEPLEKDRAMVERNKIPSYGEPIEDTVFTREYRINRDILTLTGKKEPVTVGYGVESDKRNTLYQLSASDQKRLDERGLSDD